jgi:hypothetical protein
VDHLARELADASFGDFWFWTSVLGLFVVLFFVDAFVQLRKSRMVRDLPTSKVRSAAQGQVELQGFTRYDGEAMLSPLSRRPCAWWYYELQERQRDSDGDKVWVTLEKGACETPFILEDESGRCLVEPAGAEVIHAEERQWYGRNMEAALTPKKSVRFFRKFRFTERYLWYDQPLYALGEFGSSHTSAGPEHRLSKPASAPFVLSSTSERKLARKYRRGAFTSYVAFALLGGLFISLLAARLGVGAPSDVPAGWRLVASEPMHGGSMVHETYAQSAHTNVGSVRRLAFKTLNRREHADTRWNKIPAGYRYYDCATDTVSSEIYEVSRSAYEGDLLAGRTERTGRWNPVSGTLQRELATMVCGGGEMANGAVEAEPRAAAEESTSLAPWTLFKSGQEFGTQWQFQLRRAAADVGELRRVAFRKVAMGAEAGLDGPSYYHYYDCAKHRVSPAIPVDERGSYERNLHLMGGSWLTFEQTEAAAFGFRGDAEVIALACGPAQAASVR